MTGHPTTMALNRHTTFFTYFCYFLVVKWSLFYPNTITTSQNTQGWSYELIITALELVMTIFTAYTTLRGPWGPVLSIFCDLAATEIVHAELMFSLQLLLSFCCSCWKNICIYVSVVVVVVLSTDVLLTSYFGCFLGSSPKGADDLCLVILKPLGRELNLKG